MLLPLAVACCLLAPSLCEALTCLRHWQWALLAARLPGCRSGRSRCTACSSDISIHLWHGAEPLLPPLWLAGFAPGSPVMASPASCTQQGQEGAGYDPFSALYPEDLPLLDELLAEATATHHSPATWPPLAAPARASPASCTMAHRGPPAGAAGQQVRLKVAGRAEDWHAGQPGEADGLLMGTPDTEMSQHAQQCRSGPGLQRARPLPPPQPAACAGLEPALPPCTCQGRGRRCSHCFVKAVQQLSGRCFGCPLHELLTPGWRWSVTSWPERLQLQTRAGLHFASNTSQQCRGRRVSPSMRADLLLARSQPRARDYGIMHVLPAACVLWMACPARCHACNQLNQLQSCLGDCVDMR